MINRVLIRIKVVQLLYSYLLLEKQFLLESQPSSPTKEKRFAYSLYLDFLVLMIRLARNIEKRDGSRPLYDNRFMANIMADDKIKSLLTRYRTEHFPFADIEQSLTQVIKESGIYKLFAKKGDAASGSEVSVWRDIFDTIIAVSPEVSEAVSKRENYTIRGLERAKEMMVSTFTNYFSSQGQVSDALSQLRLSLDKARELYFRLLILPIELTDLRYREIDANRHKYITTKEDLNPNLRFVENRLVEELRGNSDIREFIADNKLSWLPDDQLLLTSLLRTIKESEIYHDYMNFPATDYHTDCEFWRNVFRYIILNDSLFLEALEEKSVFWNDDIEIIGTFLLKTFRRFDSEDHDNAVLPKFKDEEDSRFGAELFTAAVKNRNKYREYIDRFVNSDSWDSERLAFMDVVILITCLAEILNFPKIPTAASINEYIEIAKAYSAPKSAGFINGLLASAIEMLRHEGILTKE